MGLHALEATANTVRMEDACWRGCSLVRNIVTTMKTLNGNMQIRKTMITVNIMNVVLRLFLEAAMYVTSCTGWLTCFVRS